MRKLLYYMSLLLTAADIIAIALVCFSAYYAWGTGRLHGRNLYILAAAGIICIVLFPVIDMMRRKSRVASKYDQYGRMRQGQEYERMSVKEQKEFDRQRLLKEEQVLPMTQVKEMTRKGSSNPEKDLSALTGLTRVKDRVAEMAARLEFDKKSRRGKSGLSTHMVFYGPPGTGKTTVAGIMAAYLKKYGYIQENRLLCTDGTFFSGENAAEKTRAAVRHAFGGMLFIDEAYAMMDGPYGAEAVSTLIAMMEDNRDKFVLILAGYENEMKRLLASNPGFSSRISEAFYFEPYSDAEMLGIFEKMAASAGFTLDEGAKNTFLFYVSMLRERPSFGNARTARNILERSISRHSLNYKNGKGSKYVLSADDIVSGV